MFIRNSCIFYKLSSTFNSRVSCFLFSHIFSSEKFLIILFISVFFNLNFLIVIILGQPNSPTFTSVSMVTNLTNASVRGSLFQTRTAIVTRIRFTDVIWWNLQLILYPRSESEYSPKWRWLVGDIYLEAKRWS